LFKHPEDRLPVALALGLTVVDFALYFGLESPWWLAGYWLLMLVPKGTISAWSHHHQHVPTFRWTPLNRLLELSHGLHSGLTSNAWFLHHVVGHHVNYLDQTKDESRWRRDDGKQMGSLEYTFTIAATAYWRCYKVGRRYPKQQRVFLTYAALTFALVTALVVYKPMQGIVLFVLPMISSLLFTAWVTYDHHAGIDASNHHEASVNTLNRRFNALTGNLGFHTAHHLRQAVHWSKLPALHRQIAHQIPAHLYREPDFALLLGNAKIDVFADAPEREEIPEPAARASKPPPMQEAAPAE
jgi:fatty acid desaturase